MIGIKNILFPLCIKKWKNRVFSIAAMWSLEASFFLMWLIAKKCSEKLPKKGNRNRRMLTAELINIWISSSWFVADESIKFGKSRQRWMGEFHEEATRYPLLWMLWLRSECVSHWRNFERHFAVVYAAHQIQPYISDEHIDKGTISVSFPRFNSFVYYTLQNINMRLFFA